MTTPRAFVPALAGMRGLAALGVVVTHVGFQTGATAAPVLGQVLGRFDLSVAVFFALSGFLLWRPHAGTAQDASPALPIRDYLRNRAVRILPAYWVVVFFVLLLLPKGDGFRVWTANLGLVQVFVPFTLTEGLTQMWSLSVEMAFYLVLPLLALSLRPMRGDRARWRVPLLLAGALLSLGWAFIPIRTPAAIHSDNWLPGYLPWFAAGMVAAEIAVAGTWPWSGKGHRRLWWTVAVATFLISALLPSGLNRLEPWQFALKITLGAILAFALLAPLVLDASGSHPLLHSRIAQTTGRWSYGVFLWHLAVLAIVFPVFGIAAFHGRFLSVLLLTVLFTLPIAAASYALVEEPARLLIRRSSVGRGSAATPTATIATKAGSATHSDPP